MLKRNLIIAVIFIAVLFAVRTSAQDATTQTFQNTAAITINDNGNASPYPSNISVNAVGLFTRMEVRLNNFSHTFPDDVDIILVGPQGQRAILMSDAGGGNPGVTNQTLTFAQTATTPIPDATAPTTGTFRPANYQNGSNIFTDTFPLPGPGALTDAAADLFVFYGINPNGIWNLYVVDDAGQDVGNISGGWTLTFTVPQIFTVTNTNDTNGVCNSGVNCSLREALAAAQDGDLINFSSLFDTPQTINLLNALPSITKSVTIVGKGANLLTVRRDYNAPTDFRIFNIPSVVANGVAISGMTITGGNAGSGVTFGGGINSVSNLTLTNVHVTGNTAGGGGGVTLAFADGVFTNCTFSNNTSTNAAGGGGGIRYSGDGGRNLRVINSTISGNLSVGSRGGGISNLSFNGNSRLEITNSTIANNTAADLAGGVFTVTEGAGTTATTTLRNTIVTGNSPNNLATGTAGGGGAATFQTLGFNLSDNFNGVFAPLGNDITSATPRLGPLSLGGGTTPTHALLGGSPAIDAGNASGSTTDQRGVNRVFDTGGIPNASDGADIGAVEMQALTVTTTADGGTGSLRNTIANANSNIALTDIIFDNAVFNTPQTINLLSALPDITGNTTINGAGANLLTVRRDSAAADFRIFNIASGITGGVAISGMTINNGRTTATGTSGSGGGILSQSNLTLTNVHITGNQASSNGGGVFLGFADGVFTGCTFSGNTAGLDGGGITYQGDGGRTLRLMNSTVSGNNSGNNIGGGILNSSVSGNNSRLEVVSSTIANNTGGQIGGGIVTFTQGAGSTATTTLRNTIIAGNSPNNLATGTAGGGAATYVTHGFNLASDNGGGFLNGTGDRINAIAGLAALALNGGATPTRALLFGSAALDAGNNSGSGTLTDQRGTGFSRTVDLPLTNAPNSDGTDIGAFEAQTTPTAPPTISVNDVTASEGDPAIFTITLSAASSNTVTLTYNTTGGTATADVDYNNQNSPATLTFAPNTTTQTVSVQTFEDFTFEPDETFNLNILSAVNATIADNQGIGTILNDDAQPTISISDVTQNEGNAGATNFNFIVSLSNASSQTVTVGYATADGTANAGSDYTGIVSITPLTFNTGETSKTLTVGVSGDTTVEPSETFFLNLFNPTNATISDNQALGTIVNDDGSCSFNLSPASPQSVPATSSNLNVTVTAPAGCAWTATTSTAWITITSGSSGNGNGTVNMTFAANTGTARTGSLTIAGQTYTINQSAGSVIAVRAPFDYDGDNKTDISIFRPAPGEWWINRSTNNSTIAFQFGATTDKIVPADYTGDGKTDVAFFRPSNGNWFVLRSEDSTFFAFPFGTNGDVPVPADYDGDGKADAAVFRESSLTWFISKSSGGTDIIGFGAAGDKPTVADYDGDRKADIAIIRPNGATGTEWWIRQSSNASVFALQFGTPTDKAVQGDYTGDGKADVAFWRPSNGFWFILRSEDLTFFAFPFGANGDIPVAGDYDGDGKSDAGVFRPSNFTWFIQRSTAGTLIQQFGIAGDLPTPSAFVP